MLLFSFVIIQSPAFDPLSDLLALADLRASCSVRFQIMKDRALRFKPPGLKFNVLRRGESWLTVSGLQPLRLLAGDCFVVNRRTFVLGSTPHLKAVNASDVIDTSTLIDPPSGDADGEFLSGSVSLTSPSAKELLELLPPLIVIQAQSPGAKPLAWLMDELDKEWRSPLPGCQSICNNLLHLSFVHVLRHYILHQESEPMGWLGGLKHPAIAKTISAIHHTPQHPWSVQNLSEIACMSRSSFADIFKRKTGQSPMEYVTHWRMQIAALKLKEGIQNTSSIASALGYQSDAAFNTAFKRVHGVPPGLYKRELRKR